MISTTNCPNCGAGLDIKNPDKAKMKYCEYCGTEIDLVSGEGKKLELYQNKPQPPKSALKLGSEGLLNGISYQVVGRIRYQDPRSLDWWDEWLLLSQNGQYLWLTEDNWEFVLMHKFTPKVPFDPNNVGEMIEIDGYKLEVEDYGSSVIQFFEGELTWKAKVGETVRYIDAWKGETVLYSCEWTKREINYFIGKDIPAETIYQVFNLGNPPEEALDDDEEDEWPESPFQKFTGKLIAGPFFKLSLAFGIMMVITAIMLGFLGNPSRNLATKNLNSPGYQARGPYHLTKVGKVHKLTTKVVGLQNKTSTLEYVIYNSDNKDIGSFEQEFWHQSGYDGGEYWSESDLKKTVYFVLSKAGDYTFVVKNSDPKVKTMPTVNISIEEGVFFTQPVWILGILLLVWPMIVIFLWLLAQSKETEYADY